VFTGKRADQYEYLKIVKRYLGKADFDKEVAKLVKAETRAGEAAERRAAAVEARREAKRAAKAAAAKARREAAKAERAATKAAEKASKAVIATFNIRINTDVDAPRVYAIAERINKDKLNNFTIELLVNGDSTKRQVFDRLKGLRLSRIHEELRKGFYFWRGSDTAENIFSLNEDGKPYNETDKLTIVLRKLSEPLKPKRMRQAFADGVVQCVADPLARMFEKYADNAESEEARKKLLRTARQIRAFGEQYPQGIPESEPMERIAKMAHRHIVIRDILQNVNLEYNTKSSKKFYFDNYRENHLNENHICFGDKPDKIKAAEFETIVEEHKKNYATNKEFYTFEGVNGSEHCIRSARGAWKLENPTHDIYEIQNKFNNISEYGFNAVKYPAVNAFLKRSVLIVATPIKLSDEMPTQHHDLKAAYTQHKMTARYEGFIGKVQQWRDVSAMDQSEVLKRLCICEFEVLKNEHPLLLNLGLTDGSYQVLPSPEIKMFIDLGVSVRLINAVFGSKLDLQYCPEIMDQKLYASWAGCLSHDSPKKEYNFPGSKEWACHLASVYGTDNVRFNKNHITVLVDKKINYTKHHILAFITSYTRINILEAMLKIKNPCVVVLDGIYHNDENVALPSEFRVKPIVEHNFFGSGWYNLYEDKTECVFAPCDALLLDHCVLAGQGGCGKTYSILSDNCFNNTLYVVPQHMLGTDSAKKYGVRYTTIHRLVGIDCVPLCATEVSPSVCLIDELTMIEAEWIEKAFDLYPNTLFFIAGDVANTSKGFLWFQCRNGKPGQFGKIYDGGNLNLKTYSEDRRSRDADLKTLKIRVREQMVKIFTDGGMQDAQRVADYIADNYKVVNYSTAAKMFKHGDTWIAGTHKTNAKLLEMGIVSGYLSKHNEKSTEAVEGWTKRGSFTTHCYQGQTIEDGKVFISINDAFEYAMIYTAVSRAVSFNQIVFVD